jgi:hypothetical protein
MEKKKISTNQYLCQEEPIDCWQHFPVLSSFMTYHWVCN